MSSKGDEATPPPAGARAAVKRQYPAEFRRQVARFIRESGTSIDEVRQALGVTRTTINSWLAALARREADTESALRSFATASAVPVEADTRADSGEPAHG